MNMTSREYNEWNIFIANFLGWFREDGQPQTWFIQTDVAKHVIYSEYKDQLRELPFHKSYDYLMPVVVKINEVWIKIKQDDHMSHKMYPNLSLLKAALVTGELDRIYAAVAAFVRMYKYYSTVVDNYVVDHELGMTDLVPYLQSNDLVEFYPTGNYDGDWRTGRIRGLDFEKNLVLIVDEESHIHHLENEKSRETILWCPFFKQSRQGITKKFHVRLIKQYKHEPA